MAKAIETTEELEKDSLEEMRERIKRLSALQGIPVTSAILTASKYELKELEELAMNVKQVGENSDVILGHLQALKSLSVAGISVGGIAEAAKLTRDSADLFDKYIINAVTKSYDNLKKIKNDKNSTNYDFFKGCLRFAADIFFAVKTFHGKIREKYPMIMAAELVFAKYVAPVYAVVGIISTVLSACNCQDKTAELIAGGMELRAEAKKANETKKEIEKEQGGVSVEDFATSCNKLEKTGVFDDVVKIVSGAKNLVDVAAKLEESSEIAKEQAVNFVKKITDVVADIPKSQAEVGAFVERIIPGAEKLPENQGAAVGALRARLNEIKDGIPASERIASTALALKKFTESFVRDGGEIPKPLKGLIGKMEGLGETIVQKGAEKVAKVIGCGMAFAEAVTGLVSILKPATPQRSGV